MKHSEIKFSPVRDGEPRDIFGSFVESYFQKRGYITSSAKKIANNTYPDPEDIDHQESLDILAINKDETLIVKLLIKEDEFDIINKDNSLNDKELSKINDFFHQAMEYLNNTPEYRWLTNKTRLIRKVIVYTSLPDNCDVKKIKQAFDKHKIIAVSGGEVLTSIFFQNNKNNPEMDY